MWYFLDDTAKHHVSADGYEVSQDRRTTLSFSDQGVNQISTLLERKHQPTDVEVTQNSYRTEDPAVKVAANGTYIN